MVTRVVSWSVASAALALGSLLAAAPVLAVPTDPRSAAGGAGAECAAALACRAAEGVDAREARLLRITRSIDDEALETVAEALVAEGARGALMGTGSARDRIARWARGEGESASERAAGPREALRSTLRDRVRDARVLATGARIEPLRAPMTTVFARVRDAAERLVRSRTDMSAMDRSAALARLANVRLRWVDAQAFVADPDAPQSVALIRGCGHDLMRDEGWVSRSWEDVVVCPGFLALQMELTSARGNGAELAAESATFLVAHELGHVIDASANDPASERRADSWATAILAEHVASRMAAGADGREIAAMALGSFCDLPGDDLHGDGTDRAVGAARALAPLLCR